MRKTKLSRLLFVWMTLYLPGYVIARPLRGLWSLFAAPLLIGCDMEKLDAFTLNLLTNDEVISVNQDPPGKQATCKPLVICGKMAAGPPASAISAGKCLLFPTKILKS